MTFQETVQQLIAEKCEKDEFSGAVLIQRGGDTLVESGQGFANRSWKIPNQLGTRFRIASISKMFTAVAILQLIDEGQLDFDTRIVPYLDLKTTRIPEDVSLYHLLTMTSGIADWFDESGDWEQDWAALCRDHPIYLFRRNEDYLPLFIDQEPVFPVGEKHQYNGGGYILLGLAIERAAGQSYEDFIQERIFDRAGMTRSGHPALDDPAAEVAEGYLAVEDEEGRVIGWKRNIYSTTPTPVADGGATSTAADLVRFSQGLRDRTLLSDRMAREMLSPKVSSSDEHFRGYQWMYGYGNYFILDQEQRIIRWGHTGEEDGVSCRLYYYPEGELDVVILGNQSWCAGSLGWEIHDLILEMQP